MTEAEIKIEGALLAMRSTLAYILAKVCRDDGEAAIKELHGILTTHVETALAKSRRTAAAGAQGAALDQLEGSAIKELDTICAYASAVIRRHQDL